MILAKTKRGIAAFAAALIMFGSLAGSAKGAVFYFDLAWSGEPGNSASAAAVIGIDTSLIPNAGFYIDEVSLPVWLDSVSLIVVGAGSGNGTYTKSDFGGLYWGTRGAVLDLGTELIGQPTNGSPWGSTDTFGGDFNLVGATAGAPSLSNYFTLAADGGTGDQMVLTSFAPSTVPEPSAALLLGLGALGWLARRRRA